MGFGDRPSGFRISSDALRKLIDKTRFAISTEETRYYLNGIYVHASDSAGVPVLRAVATDGHRLARFELPLPEGAAGMPGVIIPRKAVAEVRKLIDENDGAIDVGLSDARATKIRFAFGDVVLTSKLIDGTFPDYTRVIPTGNDKKLSVPAKDFAEAVDRVSTISSEKSRAVKLNLERERLILSVTSPENGSASEEIAVNYNGAPIEIGFNARYLLDITGQVDGEEAQIELADSASPTVVRDSGDEHSLYVLMPMRV
jgi:DNA polymerase-3 subunit beta